MININEYLNINAVININYILEPCPIPKSINLDKLKTYIFDYIKHREYFYKETNRSFYIEDEFSEFWLKSASSGIHIGTGNCATDIVTSNLESIDSMCVIMNKNISNEKSLIQNFKLSGNKLDILFDNKEDKIAVELFIDDLYKKQLLVKEKYKIPLSYIFAYITFNTEIYLCCFKYNTNIINNAKSEGFNKSNKSIIISGFINNFYGNIKLYKSKKRIELRLNINCIKNNKHCIRIY